MTKISYVSGVGAGIPTNEFADRGKEITKPLYVPFTQMSLGEALVALMRNHAVVLSQWSGDQTMAKAATLLNNALYNGLHTMAPVTGVLSPAEMWAAGVIQKTRLQAQPATKSRPRGPYYRIAKVGELIPYVSPYVLANREFAKRHATLFIQAGHKDYVEQALSPAGTTRPFGNPEGTTDTFFYGFFNDGRIPRADRERLKKEWDGLVERFKDQREIEKIYNDHLVDSSHHMLYWPIGENLQMPDRVFAKRLLHETGVSGLANAAEVDDSLVKAWLGTGIVQKNATAGLGALTPVETAFSIGGATGSALYVNYKKKKLINGIGVLTAQQVENIATLVKVAAAAAVAIIGAVYAGKNSKAQTAMAQVKGFGTDAFSAKTTDWDGSLTTGSGTAAGSSSNLLLLGGLAAGAYFLLNDD